MKTEMMLLIRLAKRRLISIKGAFKSNILPKCLLVITLAFATFAQTARAGERIALVIGNSAYRTAPLDNPRNDAIGVAKKLSAMGFDVTLETDLDRRAMLTGIRTFRDKITPQTEVALLYYAGHGMQYQGTSYLIPLHTRMEYDQDLPVEAVDAQIALQQIEDGGASVNIMILDACRNMSLKRKKRGTANGLAKINGGSNTLIAYATAPGETAGDAGESQHHSPYTEVLLEYLDKPNLSVIQLFNDIGYQVRERYGQTPWVSSSPMASLYLGGKSAEQQYEQTNTANPHPHANTKPLTGQPLQQTSQSGSPSFNCDNAQIAAEYTICQFSPLAELDNRMVAIYKQQARTSALVSAQKNWIHERNRCGSDVQCLQESYENRIGQLLSHTSSAPTQTINPSFDCRKAGTATERAICSDADLATLDRQMAALYRQASFRHSWLKQDQRDWWRTRNQCGGNIPCLTQSYRERIATLSGL